MQKLVLPFCLTKPLFVEINLYMSDKTDNQINSDEIAPFACQT